MLFLTLKSNRENCGEICNFESDLKVVMWRQLFALVECIAVGLVWVWLAASFFGPQR